MKRILLTFVFMMLPGLSLGHGFAPGLDTSEWHLEPSALNCRLWQPIPQFGMAVFEVNAGEVISFYLESDRPAPKNGKAKLLIASPSWRPGVRTQEITDLKTQKGKRPVVIKSEEANLMIDELLAGMMPTLRISGWTDNHPLDVGVSGVNFQEAYDGMLSCLATLYPVNFDQLQYSYLLFDTNKYGVKGWTKERLDLIAGYLDIDPSISHIYVYGHTDSVGRRGHNWELSRLRAQEVKEYLIKQGVDPSMITTNYYGESRPRV
ncbi:MAG: OmpA family protein, partial [Pseudomonadales bacterium]|nr:OmpA family protein [Pseudomonadales bacterium]